MTGELAAVLSEGEADLLAQQENIIEQGLTTFVEVGTALMVIRDQRLYREGFGDFEEYCQVNWGFSRSRAHRLIEAATVVSMLPIGNTPKNEGQARELVGLAPETAAAVMATAAEAGPLTAAAIRDAREVHGVSKVTHTTKTETVIDAETGEILGTRAWAVAKFPVLDVADAPDAEVVEVAKAVIAQPEQDRDMRAEIGAKSLALGVRRANGEVPMPGRREDMGKHYGRLLDDALMIQRNADDMAEWFAAQPMEQRGVWSNSLRVLHRDLGELLGRITEQPRLKVVQ